jgi:hypothetical protein
MGRLFKTTATLLLVPALLTGCEDEDDNLVGLEDCTDLAGNFQATGDFGFTGVADPSLTGDFDEAGVTFGFTLNENDTFVSTFADPAFEQDLVRTGAFEATANELTFGNEALFRGAENVEQRFTCELTETGFRLESAQAVGFDFDEDQTIEANETATFEGEFTEI